MNPTRVDHIGIGVPNLEEACKFYEALGLVSGGTEIVADQKVRVAFFPAATASWSCWRAPPPTAPSPSSWRKTAVTPASSMWPSGCQTSAQPLPR